ncbi:MAG: hypothetical protein ABJF11_15035 [Reichenbachiella sp.]|uniref:hypothetical protein n=1 Tax=Reichenbachiella sp. TaxID=2184521 RepID=UPI003264DD62
MFTTIKLYTFLALMLCSITAFCQATNYSQGLNAYQDKRYNDAIEFLTDAVNNDKYEISGKELSTAYTYLAVLQVAQLRENLDRYSIEQIRENSGKFKTAIAMMRKGIEFENKKLGLKTAQRILIFASMKSASILLDSIVKIDPQTDGEHLVEMVQFMTQEFADLEKISSNNWELLDMFGKAYYYMGDKEKALSKFKTSREIFSTLKIKPLSKLHLENYELSCRYLYEQKNNPESLSLMLTEGIIYARKLVADQNDEQMSEFLALSRRENRLNQLKAKLSNGK